MNQLRETTRGQMQAPVEIPEPQNCRLWRNEGLENIRQILETVETYIDDSHDRRCLLRCRKCGQLYFYRLLEFVDYENGEDPQYRTYIPVKSPQDAARLSEAPEWELNRYKPAIHDNWPKGKEKPVAYWIR